MTKKEYAEYCIVRAEMDEEIFEKKVHEIPGWTYSLMGPACRSSVQHAQKVVGLLTGHDTYLYTLPELRRLVEEYNA